MRALPLHSLGHRHRRNPLNKFLLRRPKFGVEWETSLLFVTKSVSPSLRYSRQRFNSGRPSIYARALLLKDLIAASVFYPLKLYGEVLELVPNLGDGLKDQAAAWA